MSSRLKFRLYLLAAMTPLASLMGFGVYLLWPHPTPQDELTTALGPISQLTWDYDNGQNLSNIEFTLEGAMQTFRVPLYGIGNEKALLELLQAERDFQTLLTVWYDPQDGDRITKAYQIANTDGTKLLDYEELQATNQRQRNKGLYMGLVFGLISLVMLAIYLRIRYERRMQATI